MGAYVCLTAESDNGVGLTRPGQLTFQDTDTTPSVLRCVDVFGCLRRFI